MSVGSYLSADLSRVLEEFGFDDGAVVDDDEVEDQSLETESKSGSIVDDVFDGSNSTISTFQYFIFVIIIQIIM
jgi:hypothetical protein